VDFQVSVTDMRDNVPVTRKSQSEIDCLISAEPQHRVGDLIMALLGVCEPDARLARDSGLPGLWLDGRQLDPAAPLAASGIHDSSRLGLGGWPTGADKSTWPGTAEIRVVAGPDAGLVVPVGTGEYTVGRDGGDVPLTNNDVSRRHCVIAVSVTAGGVACTIRDIGSRNGTGLDGVAVGQQPEPVRPGQLIAVGRDTLTVALPLAESAMLAPGGPSDPFGWRLSKPPRDHPIPLRPVIIDLGAEPSQRDRMPSWLTMLIGPAVALAAGVAVGAFTHQWLFLLLGLGGVVVTLVTQVSGRRAASCRLRSAQREFHGAAATGQARLAEAIAAEQRQRRDVLPDPAHVTQIASGPGSRLWERLPADEDFLHLRVGSADLPAASVDLHGSAAGVPDPLVRDVPLPVGLRDLGVLGIAGPARLSRPALAWVVAQLAVLHSPRDVRFVVLTEEPEPWRWTRWLPHLRSLPGMAASLSIGTDPQTWAARAAELTDLVDKRRAAAADPRRIDRRPPAPAVVVMLDGSYRLCQQPGIATVLAEGPAVGVYSVCRGDDRAELPRECAGQLLIDPAGDGRASYRERGRAAEVTKLDVVVNARWADRVARALAPIRDAPGDQRAGMPGTIRLLDLWGVDRPTAARVADEWQRRGRTTAVPLGRTGTGTFVLDIARDGPHMLVAGTTGAGKSEFLQTLVASLAFGNTPDALVFVLIDYKGGSAFAGCAALPHVAGFLTDLDEHLTQRALVALGAEVRYRERLLLDAKCKDIDDYHAAGEPRGPLPRLVLVVDEFRFLVDQMPDFLQRLTDVTARGRSLGIHLVLATQRPAGVVSEDIRTNMALRVCFRVEDAADSTAVVEFPDAAAIDRQFRGRGYARTERGAATMFQGGYVGGPPGVSANGTALRAVARSFSTLGSLSSGQRPERDSSEGDQTDLALLVQAIRATGQQPPRHRAWLDPLPPLIPLRNLPAARSRDVPPVGYGVEDRPAEQAQRVIALDLEAGSHLLVGGAPQSGRTTMLRTIAAGIAARQSPGDVHLYVLDCDASALAPLARLPHCGAVVRRTEKERAARLLDRLSAEIARRQELLASAGFASITEQRRAAAGADRLPYMVLLLDRWEGFLADLGQVDSGRLPELMARLLSEGASAGLRVVATGDKTALIRLTSQFPDRLVLRLSDANDLLMAGVPKGAMPASPPPGHGIAVPGGSEVQIAFTGDDPDGSAQTAALDAMIRDAVGTNWPPGPRPLRVDVIPAKISLAQARAIPGWTGTRGPLQPAVAVGGDELCALGIDLARFPGFAIAGPPLSGRSTALLIMAGSLLETGTAVIGFAPRESPLRRLADYGGVTAVFTDTSPDPVKLKELLESAVGPLAVLVDDAEALHQAPVAEVLAQIPVEGRGRGHALVVAGTSSELLRSVRGFTAGARQFRCGLLLTPEAAQLGHELFGTKLPRSAVFDRPSGRGYLIQVGQATLVQVPEPPAS
jgi:S-DNA-T family DNA segregation ATPase FtsK/SpoIIIE